MAAKKKSSTKPSAKKPINKSAFVRSLSASMPGADVVKKAKEAGISISLAYVYGIRSKTNGKRPKSAAKSASSVPAASPPAKRGPGRPPKSAAATNGNRSTATRGTGGLEAEIEAIVERKVTELLKSRLGALFG
jgi:hypothetical protein